MNIFHSNAGNLNRQYSRVSKIAIHQKLTDCRKPEDSQGRELEREGETLSTHFLESNSSGSGKPLVEQLSPVTVAGRREALPEKYPAFADPIPSLLLSHCACSLCAQLAPYET
jgi:hypothetical protein